MMSAMKVIYQCVTAPESKADRKLAKDYLRSVAIEKARKEERPSIRLNGRPFREWVDENDDMNGLSFYD